MFGHAGRIASAPVSEALTHPSDGERRTVPAHHEPASRPSAGPGKPGCKLATFLRGSAAALPKTLRERRCQREKLLAVVFEQQEPLIRDPQPFPQRGGTGGRQISSLGA